MKRRNSKEWLTLCKKARRLLESGKAKTVVDVAEQLGVNHRMLSRNAKKYSIVLNLKGHGIKKVQSSSTDNYNKDDYWSIALNLKVA